MLSIVRVYTTAESETLSGTIDPDGRFSAITPKVAKELIQDVLISKCGYKARDIMFFGFGQGGMVALNVAGKYAHRALPRYS